jgi:condensin complex subunit 2
MSETTLAPSFASLQLKKLELEFAVDPLFKKASADFDEGGAKGLLLNHLMIDGKGRIVFDSSDDAGDASADRIKPRRREDVTEEDEDVVDENDATITEDKENEPEEEEVEIDIGALGAKFFPDLSILENQDICPSLKDFDLGNLSGSLDIPFLRAGDDWQDNEDTVRASGDKSGMFIDEDNLDGFDDITAMGGFDAVDVAFGEGGEAWAREAALDPQMRPYNVDAEDGMGDGDISGLIEDKGDNEDYVVRMDLGKGGSKMHEDILSYFDQALQKNWAGPEHWRIRKIKDANKAEPSRQRKEKEPFEIDFASPLDAKLADQIYNSASNNSAISMPKKDWKSKTRNLLPDDKHFNSKQLLSLFLKPKARMSGRRRLINKGGVFGTAARQQDNLPDGEMDEAFWANKEALPSSENDDTVLPKGDYDANFFDDEMPLPGGGLLDDEEDMEFADARDHFSPGAEVPMTENVGFTGMFNGGFTTGGFGTQLVTSTRRLRPEYVQYARRAKKVDVRRLKEELWKGMGLEKLEVSLWNLDRPPSIYVPCIY